MTGMDGASDGSGATPILPAHIEDTVEAIAKVHADHHAESGRVQRLLERVTGWIGRPRFIAGMTAAVVLWMAGNTLVTVLGGKAWDEPPFAWLELVVSLLALYVTVLILATQRRDDELAPSYRPPRHVAVLKQGLKSSHM